MSGHTPGPWTWDVDGNLYPSAALAVYQKAVNEDRWDDIEYVEPIVQTDSGAYGPRGVDRSLIAAAPELLAACQSVIAWFETMKADHGAKLGHGLAAAVKNWDSIIQPPLDMTPLYAAIAKATKAEQ